VLPAHNEEANLEHSVRRLVGALSAVTQDFEILVVNDGSTDATGDILRALHLEHPEFRLRVVTHERNRGYGAALASGFDAAQKEFIFFTDSDGQFDVNELQRLLDHVAPSIDMAIGWGRHRADPPMRRFNALGWKLLVNGLFGYTAQDIDCAFKLFRRRVWTSLTVHATGATFSAELLIKARRLEFSIVEVPVAHFPRSAGSATGARPDVIARAFCELFRLRWNLSRELSTDPRVAAFESAR